MEHGLSLLFSRKIFATQCFYPSCAWFECTECSFTDFGSDEGDDAIAECFEKTPNVAFFSFIQYNMCKDFLVTVGLG